MLIQIVRLFAVEKIPASELKLPTVQANAQTLHTILNAVFEILGAVAILFILIGAIRYMISGGNSGQIQQARDTILYAAIGLGLSTLAFTIVQFVLGRFS